MSKPKPTVNIKVMSPSEQRWHGAKPGDPHLMLTVENRKHINMRDFFGVIDGRYSNKSLLAKNIGAVTGNGTLGSRSILCRLCRFHVMLKHLLMKGYVAMSPVPYSRTYYGTKDKQRVKELLEIANKKYEET